MRIDTLSLPPGATLRVSGVDVIPGDVIAAAQLGSLVLAPASDANGTGYATFTFTVQDPGGAFAAPPNTMTIDVTAVNDAPQAVNDSYGTIEDLGLIVGAPGVLGNDADIDGGPLTAVLVSGPTNAASFTLNANGSFAYMPNWQTSSAPTPSATWRTTAALTRTSLSSPST